MVDRIERIVDSQKGDFLTITQGIYEITVFASKKYRPAIQKALINEQVIKVVGNLSTLTVRVPEISMERVGVFYTLVKALTWENINIIDMISTLTEITFVLRDNDVSPAFNTLKSLMGPQ